MTLFPIVQAHEAEDGDFHHVSLLDFEPGSDGITLVVAMQTDEVFDLVQRGPDEELNLEAIRRGGELLAAFVEGRIRIFQDGSECDWNASPDSVPDSMLEVQAEGVTVRGLVECPAPIQTLSVHSDLFIDAYPDHHNVIRVREDGRFVTLAELDFTEQEATITLSKSTSRLSADTPMSGTFLLSVGVLVALVVATSYIAFTKKLKKKRTR